MKYKNILYIDKADSIYTRAIKLELKKHAVNVDCFYQADLFRPSIFQEKFNPGKFQTEKRSKISIFIHYLKTREYDFILIKSPYVWPTHFFEELSDSFKMTPIVNFNWSSVKMYNVLPYLSYFTKVYSFDSADCKQYGFDYYPLFYLHEFGELQKKKDKIYDLSFIGTGYSAGRICFMKTLVNVVHKEKLNAFLYFYTPGIVRSLKLKVKHSAISKYCYWQQLSINEVVNVFKKSTSVIDHAMTIQTGLTIRTFEALGAGLHLFTTNRAIINEPFFNADKITIIDTDLNNFYKNDIKINKQDNEWQESFTQYRVDNWVKKILDIY